MIKSFLTFFSMQIHQKKVLKIGKNTSLKRGNKMV